MQVPIDEVRVGKRLRQPRPERIAALADSIRQIGLQQPISLASDAVKLPGGGNGVRFDLVAGLHRLEACRRLGWDSIEATIVQMTEGERLLWEIDENLCRADLTELERGEHLLKRKEVYETLYPQTRQHHAGAAAANEALGNATADSAVASFAADSADKTGAAERTIRQSIRRAAKIDAKVRDRIRDNPEIADSGVELDALAAMEPAAQRKAVALVEAGHAAGVRDARKLMEPSPVKPNFKPAIAADEKWWQRFLALWAAASDANQQRARDHLRDALIIGGDQ